MSKEIIKVLFIADIGEKGGASKQLLDLVCGLKKHDDVEIVVVNSKRNAINDILTRNNVKNYSISYYPFIIPSETGIPRLVLKFMPRVLQYYLFNRKAKRQLDKIVDENNINIIHSYINRVDIGPIVAQKHNITHIWHIHEFGELDYKCISLVPKYIRYMNQFKTSYIAISNAVKNYWQKKGLIGEIDTIYNGVNIELASDNKKLDFSVLNVVMVGTICETKGQYQLIEAVHLLPQEYIDRMYFTIIGSGVKAYKKRLKKLVNMYGLNNHINFVGYKDNISEELNNYNVGITASRSEGFGRVTVEYMAKRILPVVSNTGANTELVNHEKTGLVYEYSNVQNLADKLMYIIDNQETCKELVNNAYKVYQSRYTVERYVDNVYEYYRKKT